MKIPLLAVTLFAIVLLFPFASHAQFITDVGTNGIVQNPFSPSVTNVIGWQINVGALPLLVTALGTWDNPATTGLQSSMLVGVWETSTQKLLSSVTVPAGTDGTLIGQYRYTDLSLPLTLAPNTSSTFGERLEGPGTHSSLRYSQNVQYADVATFTAFGMNNGGGGQPFNTDFSTQMPTQNLGDSIPLMGPNFLFTVPEPSTGALFLCGITLLGFHRRRRISIRGKLREGAPG